MSALQRSLIPNLDGKRTALYPNGFQALFGAIFPGQRASAVERAVGNYGFPIRSRCAVIEERSKGTVGLKIQWQVGITPIVCPPPRPLRSSRSNRFDAFGIFRFKIPSRHLQIVVGLQIHPKFRAIAKI